MFFCETCKVKNNWPTSWTGLYASFGPCEVCGMSGPCYDVPSKHLPLPPKILTEKEVNR